MSADAPLVSPRRCDGDLHFLAAGASQCGCGAFPRPVSSPTPDGRTHSETCYTSKGHHDCALEEIKRLQAELGQPPIALGSHDPAPSQPMPFFAPYTRPEIDAAALEIFWVTVETFGPTCPYGQQARDRAAANRKAQHEGQENA